ncbi:MAG: hypothetical protein ACJ76X_08705 [Solirubrobacteraceae bacterium]
MPARPSEALPPGAATTAPEPENRAENPCTPFAAARSAPTRLTQNPRCSRPKARETTPRAGTGRREKPPALHGRAAERLLLESGTGELSVAALRSLGLTPRQAETLRFAALGHRRGNRDPVGIAPRTVEKHLEHVYDNLGVHSLSQATAIAWAAVGLQPPARDPPARHDRPRSAPLGA